MTAGSPVEWHHLPPFCSQVLNPGYRQVIKTTLVLLETIGRTEPHSIVAMEYEAERFPTLITPHRFRMRCGRPVLESHDYPRSPCSRSRLLLNPETFQRFRCRWWPGGLRPHRSSCRLNSRGVSEARRPVDDRRRGRRYPGGRPRLLAGALFGVRRHVIAMGACSHSRMSAVPQLG
jgi:hypothetical protein